MVSTEKRPRVFRTRAARDAQEWDVGRSGCAQAAGTPRPGTEGIPAESLLLDGEVMLASRSRCPHARPRKGIRSSRTRPWNLVSSETASARTLSAAQLR